MLVPAGATLVVWAYLDPGTGSFIFQIVAGAIFAALVTIKMYWFRLKAFAGRLFGREEAPQDDEQPRSAK